jgi:hypothetical protein
LVGIVTIRVEDQVVSAGLSPYATKTRDVSTAFCDADHIASWNVVKPPASTLGRRRPRYTSRRKAGAHGFVSHCTVRTFLNARSSLRPAPDRTHPLVCNPRPWGVTRVVWPLLDESGWHLLPGCGRLFLSSRLGQCSERGPAWQNCGSSPRSWTRTMAPKNSGTPPSRCDNKRMRPLPVPMQNWS